MQFPQKSFFSSRNGLYIIFEGSTILGACNSYETAQTHLTINRRIEGPIPMLQSLVNPLARQDFNLPNVNFTAMFNDDMTFPDVPVSNPYFDNV